MGRTGRSAATLRTARAQLEVESLESRLVPAAGLEHHVAANMIDPTGHKDGVQRVSWSEPGTSTTVKVFLNTRSGANTLTPAQKARIRAGIVEINRAWNTWDGANGVRLVEVGSMAEANVRVQNSATSRIGGLSQGVFGVADYYTFDTGLKGQDGKVFHRFVGAEFGTAYQASVIMISGWNWYAGARSSGIGRGQYDYQTIVTHELAHAVGLEHDSRTYAGLNGDGKSVMLPWGMPGRPHRRLSASDLASLRYLYAGAAAPSEGGHGNGGNAARAQGSQVTHEMIATPRGILAPFVPMPAHSLVFSGLVRATQVTTELTARRDATLSSMAPANRAHGLETRSVATFDLTAPPMESAAAQDERSGMDCNSAEEIDGAEFSMITPAVASKQWPVQSQAAAKDESIRAASFPPARRGGAGAAAALAFLLPTVLPVLPVREKGGRSQGAACLPAIASATRRRCG